MVGQPHIGIVPYVATGTCVHMWIENKYLDTVLSGGKKSRCRIICTALFFLRKRKIIYITYMYLYLYLYSRKCLQIIGRLRNWTEWLSLRRKLVEWRENYFLLLLCLI